MWTIDRSLDSIANFMLGGELRGMVRGSGGNLRVTVVRPSIGGGTTAVTLMPFVDFDAVVGMLEFWRERASVPGIVERRWRYGKVMRFEQGVLLKFPEPLQPRFAGEVLFRVLGVSDIGGNVVDAAAAIGSRWMEDGFDRKSVGIGVGIAVQIAESGALCVPEVDERRKPASGQAGINIPADPCGGGRTNDGGHASQVADGEEIPAAGKTLVRLEREIPIPLREELAGARDGSTVNFLIYDDVVRGLASAAGDRLLRRLLADFR